MVPVHLAAARAAQRHVLKRLRSEGAVSPRSARALDGLSAREARQLARLVDSGMVRQANPGAYYVDEDAVAEDKSRRMRILIVVLAILSVLIITALVHGRG